MWADIDTKQDFLNYGETATLVAEVIADTRMLPTSIGVFGSWGTGKSTLLNIIEQEIRGSETTKSVILVRFDAWLYQGYDDAKAALMDVISESLITTAEAAQNDGLIKRAMGLAGRVRWFRAVGFAAEIVAAVHGTPLFGGARAAAAGAEQILEGAATEDDLKKVRDGTKEVSDKVAGLVKPKTVRTPPKEVDEFKEEFGALLRDLDRTLVVFVDNLDRCMPEQTIRTLEAMRLFLFMNKTAFVVAADEDMVRRSVRAYFSDIGDKHVTDYLDKLVQVPVRVPMLGVREVRAYLFQLLADASSAGADKQEQARTLLSENMQAAWKDDPTAVEDVLGALALDVQSEEARSFFTADRISQLLAIPPVNGNPRIIKRMLNVVRMRARLARRRNMPVSEDIIAKVALFERCMDEDATRQFYAFIQAAEDGQVRKFAELEGAVSKPDFAEALPDSWKKDADLLRQWFALEPKVSGDLRPIAYLGRDTVALSVQRGVLSQAGRIAFNVLLAAASASGVAAKEALAKLASSENSLLMEALASEMRKELDWSKAPKGWWGSLILSDHDPSTLGVLQRVIAERAGGKPPPWLVAAARQRNLLQRGNTS